MRSLVILLALATVSIASARGQGFQNLNFESAYGLPANPGNGALVSVTNALPGWSTPFLNIYYVSNSLGDVSSAVELEGGSLALSGDFSVGLFSDGSISQTGLVPEDAESLQFEADSPINVVTLGGQTLSYALLSAGPNYRIYGANIPAGMDGQMEALTFGILGPGEALLDNIEFSTSSVPEPGECALIGIGAMVFGYCRRIRRV